MSLPACFPTTPSTSSRLSPSTLADLGERPELPGPLAVSLSRRTIKTLEASPYVVCEKSDGERAMLLFVATPCK